MVCDAWEVRGTEQHAVSNACWHSCQAHVLYSNTQVLMRVEQRLLAAVLAKAFANSVAMAKYIIP